MADSQNRMSNIFLGKINSSQQVMAGFRPLLPYHMVWLATNACNARCIHCSSDAAKPLPAELTTQEAKSMFTDLATNGVFDVAISGGEPLSRKDIFEVMEHAAHLNIRMGLGSNGSTITTKVARRLKILGLDRLQISIDGLEETHDKSRRWQGLFQKSQRAILLGIKEGLSVHVCFTTHKINFKEIEKVIDLAYAWGVKRFNLSRLVPTGRGNSSLDLTPSEWKEVNNRFEIKRAEYQGRMELTTHLAQLILTDPTLYCRPGFMGCQAGLGQGCINSEGEVFPCVMLPISVGNIRNRPLQEIWLNSSLIRSLQNRNNLIGWCNTCEFREKCGGCRGLAFSYSGNPFAADPRCWLYANQDNLPTTSNNVINRGFPIQITRSKKGAHL